MTKEDRQLLLVDLCARLPYRVIVRICSRGENAVRDVILSGDNITNAFGVPEGWWKEIKPYLRPMSSMTEEEKEQTRDLWIDADTKTHATRLIDFYNKHHFDYRGLIEKGLAIKVTKENNPYDNF